MSKTKYWLELWQGQDQIDIDFGYDFNQRQSVIEALRSTNVRTEAYESHIEEDVGE